MARRAASRKTLTAGGTAAPSDRAREVDRGELLTLREAAARYHAIFEQLVDAIVIVGSDGYLLEFNTAAHENLDYTREEFTKLHISEIDALESREQVAEHIARILADGAGRFETKHRTKAGEIRAVVISANVIKADGKSLFVSVWRDVTAERQAQQALKRKNAALLEVLAQAQQAKDDIGWQIHVNLEKVIVPMLHELRRELPPDQQGRLAALVKALEEITSPFAAKLSSDLDRLTAVEIRICRLIREGMRTKDIAQLQHISPATVAKHRENIRRKLGIQGKNVNLTSHLDSLPDRTVAR